MEHLASWWPHRHEPFLLSDEQGRKAFALVSRIAVRACEPARPLAGTVATSQPRRAAVTTCSGWRIDAASTCVVVPPGRSAATISAVTAAESIEMSSSRPIITAGPIGRNWKLCRMGSISRAPRRR